MFKKHIYILLILVFSAPAQDSMLPFCKAIDGIGTVSLQNHLNFLGHDSLKGRATGSRGEQLAAQYIISRLEKHTIQPLPGQGSYLQTIPMHSSRPLSTSRLILYKNSIEHPLVLEQDYLLYKSGPQTLLPNPVPLVFVGYGIIAPEYDYNDYQSVNIQGKIAVYLDGEPHSNDPKYFSGRAPSVYSYLESKQRLAISRGARGSVVIPNPRAKSYQSWHDWRRAFGFEQVTLAYSVASHFSIIMNPNKAEKLFEGAPFSLIDIYNMDARGAIQSFPLNTSISFQGQFEERDFFSSNVIGYIPGRAEEHKESYLLLSAHYDHLGIGKAVKGDSIYNGVFDNAAGVAALLEIGRAFQNMKMNPKRSVLLLFLTGEEKGLLGSTYYVDHPLVPLYKTIANINIDGLAMFDTFNDIVGVGAELSDLGKHLSAVGDLMGLETNQIPSRFLRTESFGRSDQIAFAKAGIPSILIMEGLNYRHLKREKALQNILFWMKNIYHTPFDDLDQAYNIKAALQHTRFLFAYAWYLANAEETIEWKTGVPYNTARLQTTAEER